MADALHPADVAFGVVLSFLAGVFAASVGWPPYLLGVALAIIALIVIFWWSQNSSLYFYCALALLLGLLYFHGFKYVSVAQTHLPTGEQTTFTALIVAEPQPIEKSILLTAALTPPWHGTVTIFAPLTNEFEYGDVVKVTGRIGDQDERYDYPAVFFAQNLTLIAKHQGFWLREYMLRIKYAVLKKFDEALPRDESALLGGMLLGARASFAPALKEAMALSGTTHLVAVSGYNISIIILVVDAALRKYLSRRATFAVSSVILALFILMIGGIASAVRAGVMGFLALFARQAGEEFSMRNAIVFVAALMVIFDPRAITKNIGFLLSFMALLGIVYIAPAIKKLVRRNSEQANDEKNFFNWKESAIMTVSAQIAVTPVLMLGFGSVSAVGILANILIVDAIPFTMLLGVMLIPIGFISHTLLVLAGKIAWLPLAYELFIIRLFAGFAVPLLLPIHSALAVFLYYLAVIGFIYRYRN